MERIFKIRCSQISKIMGRVGLSEAQEKTFNELLHKPTKRTEIQESTLKDLLEKKSTAPHLALPQTCKSYLHEWYANDHEEIYSKEITKGNLVEAESIDFCVKVLNLGVAAPTLQMEDDHITGKCDIEAAVLDAIIDTKNPYNNKSFQSNIDVVNYDYVCQGKGYCHLYKRSKFILFYSLMNTPEECNYGTEVTYDYIPETERWIAYEFKADPEFINEVIERVKLCRLYLDWYDAKVKSKLGKIISVE